MPYKVFQFRDENGKIKGYKVGKKDGTLMGNGRRYASNKFLTLKNAKNQMKALYASENNKNN